MAIKVLFEYVTDINETYATCDVEFLSLQFINIVRIRIFSDLWEGLTKIYIEFKLVFMCKGLNLLKSTQNKKFLSGQLSSALIVNFDRKNEKLTCLL